MKYSYFKKTNAGKITKDKRTSERILEKKLRRRMKKFLKDFIWKKEKMEFYFECYNEVSGITYYFQNAASVIELFSTYTKNIASDVLKMRDSQKEIFYNDVMAGLKIAIGNGDNYQLGDWMFFQRYFDN